MDPLIMFKIELRSVLIAMKDGVPFRRLDNEFQDRSGRRIPYRDLGFATLKDLIHNLPDVAYVSFDQGEARVCAVADESTAHIASLVARQKGKSKRRSTSRSYGSVRPYGPLRGNSRMTGAGYAYQNMPDFKRVSPTMRAPPPIVTPTKPKPPNQRLSPAVANLFSTISTQKESLCTNIRKLFMKYPDGIYLHEFARLYQRFSSDAIDRELPDPRTLRMLLESMPDDVRLVESSNNTLVLPVFGVGRHQPSTQPGIGSEPTNVPAHRCVSMDEFVQTLTSLLHQHPDGLLLSDLESQYKKFSGERLPLNDLNASDVESLLFKLPSGFVIEALSKNMSILKFVSAQSPTAHLRKPSIPDDAMLPGFSIPVQSPPPVSDSYVKVRVSNVINPNSFSIQLIGKQTTTALDDLMVEMQSAYSDPGGSAYVMPSSLICVGQLCAARYTGNGEWHRAYIVSYRDSEVQVCYADYGTVEWIHTPLRLLRKKFTQLPLQAIPSRLTNVRPVSESWSHEACVCFMKLVTDRDLFAVVTDVDKDCCLSVCLTDTSSHNKDIHINDYLVDYNYATFQNDIRTPAAELLDQHILKWKAESHVGSGGTLMSGGAPSYCVSTAVGSMVMAGDGVQSQDCCVKLVELTAEYRFHQIIIRGVAYMISSEVSALLWTEDKIRTKLRERGCTHLSKLLLSSDDDADIFQSLQEHGVPGVLGSPIVVLYELASVVEILELFKHPSEQLKIALQRHIDLFNPRDSCWKTQVIGTVNDDDDDDESLSGVSHMPPTHDRWTELTNKRKQLIAKLSSTKSSAQSAEIVEKLKSVEQQLQYLKPPSSRAHRKHGGSSDESFYTAEPSAKANNRPTAPVDTASHRPIGTSAPMITVAPMLQTSKPQQLSHQAPVTTVTAHPTPTRQPTLGVTATSSTGVGVPSPAAATTTHDPNLELANNLSRMLLGSDQSTMLMARQNMLTSMLQSQSLLTSTSGNTALSQPNPYALAQQSLLNVAVHQSLLSAAQQQLLMNSSLLNPLSGQPTIATSMASQQGMSMAAGGTVPHPPVSRP